MIANRSQPKQQSTDARDRLTGGHADTTFSGLF
jgi:hypothetical protein